jgi:signal transduction histidine kinase
VVVDIRATEANVDATITDNGRGFDVERTLAQAARRGRLGLVGVFERIRLLGGTCDVRSRPGGPTTISVALPRWYPLSLDGAATEPVAAASEG